MTDVCQSVYQQLNHWTHFFKNCMQITCQKLVLTLLVVKNCINECCNSFSKQVQLCLITAYLVV